MWKLKGVGLGWMRDGLSNYTGRLFRPSIASQKDSAQDRAVRSTAAATWVMAFIAFATMAVGIAQWSILRGTLEEIQDQERAWLSFEVRPRGGLVVGADGVSTSFDVIVKNHGHRPALAVQTRSRLLALPPHPVRQDNYGYESGPCRKPFDSQRSLSAFPDESTNLGQQFPRIERAAIDRVKQSGLVTLILEVCIQYSSAGDRRIHSTQNDYVLAHHWIPTEGQNGLIKPQQHRYDFKSDLDIDVPDFDHLGYESAD